MVLYFELYFLIQQWNIDRNNIVTESIIISICWLALTTIELLKYGLVLSSLVFITALSSQEILEVRQLQNGIVFEFLIPERNIILLFSLLKLKYNIFLILVGFLKEIADQRIFVYRTVTVIVEDVPINAHYLLFRLIFHLLHLWVFGWQVSQFHPIFLSFFSNGKCQSLLLDYIIW